MFTRVDLQLISVLLYVSNVEVDQGTARADCHSHNAELVSISDVAENATSSRVSGLCIG